MKRLLAAAALLALAIPGRAVPNFSTKETGIVLNAGTGGVSFSSAVFTALTGGYADAGGGVRGFYIRESTMIFSARSADGLAWSDESGVRVSSFTQPPIDISVSSITGAAVQVMNSGGYRMIYAVYGTTGTYRLYTATSADGLNWGNQYSTAVITSANNGTSYLTSPSIVKLASGDWRLYYTENSIAGNQPANRRIVSSLSTNEGATWAGATVEASPANEAAAIKRTDGKVRLIYTTPLTGSATSVQMLSALSGVTGTGFSAEAGIQIATTTTVGSMSSPAVFRSTDGFRWRLYYNYLPFAPPGITVSTANVFTAVTDYPDLQSVAPSTVFQTNPSAQFSLIGEIFDTTAVTSFLKQAGQANLVGGAIVRTDDQNITITYPTNLAPLGYWDSVVTNGNGLTSTITGAVLIDFQGGTVNLTDNLFRPLSGTKTKIAVTIFTPGAVTVRLYTLNGALINTLWDGNLPGGTTNFFWNGTTAHGSVVASGVYLLKITGPKLNTINKIVAIK